MKQLFVLALLLAPAAFAMGQEKKPKNAIVIEKRKVVDGKETVERREITDPAEIEQFKKEHPEDFNADGTPRNRQVKKEVTLRKDPKTGEVKREEKRHVE